MSSVDQVVTQAIQDLEVATHQPLYTQLSQEEQQAIIEKMRHVVIQPAGHLQKQEELYLEQQLSDMFGCEVLAELDGHRLNHSIGTMKALPHLKRHPTDTLTEHDVYQEAGLSEHRSFFGWFTDLGKLTPAAIEREKYYMAVQADFVPGWHEQYRELIEWYRFRKMIVINPVEEKAVVTVVGNLGPADWMQHQFGGSPEVIREAGIWSLRSAGHVLVLFLNDPENAVQLGPINLQNISQL